MNKEQRSPYLELANLAGDGWGLCNWCKFAEWDGYSCCEAQLLCQHPLDVINGLDDDCEHMDAVWGEGADCWGFRPHLSLQECGIITSIRASGNMAHKNKHGEWVAIVPSKRDREEMLIQQI